MATILSVKFRHEGFIRVADHEDTGVKGLNLLPAALMGLDTYSPATAPVISLPFETCTCTCRDIKTSRVNKRQTDGFGEKQERFFKS